MASQPMLRELAILIESKGGEDWFFGEVMNGVTVTALAKVLGCTRGLLYAWLNRGSGRMGKLAEARKVAAHVLVERCLDELNAAQGIASVREQAERARFNQWVASKWNRPAYGESPTVEVQVNLAELHLQALQAPLPAHLLQKQEEMKALRQGDET